MAVTSYSSDETFFMDSVDPTGTEPDVTNYGFPSGWIVYWWNTATNDLFYCVDALASPLVWIKQISSENVLSMLLSLGWELNTPRSYSSQSLSFSTPRTPNADNDTLVLANVSMQITLLQACTIEAQVDSGAGYVTVAQCSLTAAAASTVGQCLSFMVPAGADYQLIESGSGTNTIVSARELTM